MTVVSSGAIGKSVRGGEYRRYVGRVPWVIRFHTTCKMLAADPAVLCGHPGASVFPLSADGGDPPFSPFVLIWTARERVEPGSWGVLVRIGAPHHAAIVL